MASPCQAQRSTKCRCHKWQWHILISEVTLHGSVLSCHQQGRRGLREATVLLLSLGHLKVLVPLGLVKQPEGRGQPRSAQVDGQWIGDLARAGLALWSPVLTHLSQLVGSSSLLPLSPGSTDLHISREGNFWCGDPAIGSKQVEMVPCKSLQTSSSNRLMPSLRPSIFLPSLEPCMLRGPLCGSWNKQRGHVASCDVEVFL